MSFRKRSQALRIRLHVGIATVFVLVVAALTISIIWINYRQTSAAALQTADQLFVEIASKVDERMNGMLGSVKATVDAASAVPGLSDRPRYDGLSHPALEAMIRMIEAQPYVFSVFVGFGSGDWLQVLVTGGDAGVTAAFHVPDDAHFVIRTITEDRTGTRNQYLRYLDRQRHVVGARSDADPSYDPRSRLWYSSALAADRTRFTDPFVFFALQEPGITSSRRLIGGGGVVGAAVTLSSISQFLSEQSASENATTFLFNSKGEILAHQDPSRSSPVFADGADRQSDGSVRRRADDIGDPLVEAVIRERLSSDSGASALRRLEVGGQTDLVRVEPVGLKLGLDQFIAIAAPLTDFTQHIRRTQQRSIVASMIALAVALPLIYLIARRVAAKLGRLAAEADRIRSFDLEGPVDVESMFVEIQNLSQAFGAMKQAVRVFGRYVPKALVQQIVQSGTPPGLGGHRQMITVLFTDVADFTRIAEETEPEELMLRTSEYFEALGAVLSRYDGVVDKYIGDAVMALWNAPSRDDDHVAHACAAVLACREISRELAEKWHRQAIPPFATRFGLHCGEAVVGNVGGADRINFTAVGATINLASRLEALNKHYGTEILVSEDVARQAGQRFLMRQIDRVQPVGVNMPVDVYTLVAALPGRTKLPASFEPSAEQIELCAQWDRAYEAYAERDWQRALADFEALLDRYPQDEPARIFVARCRGFIETPPDPGWDGVTYPNRK